MTSITATLDLPASLADALVATITPPATDAPLVTRLTDDLRRVACRPGAPPSGAMPAAVHQHLPTLVAAMPSTPIAAALRPFMNAVSWYQIFDGAQVPDTLAGGLMAGQIVGGRGILSSDELYFGLFLLAPGITYPLHQHAALEIYCVLSGEVLIRHGRAKPARRIQAGGHSVTPPHQVHELRTEDEACLIAYVWTGDLTGENWWWEERPDGGWDRVCWQRQTDSSWKITRREPLSDAEIASSGDR